MEGAKAIKITENLIVSLVEDVCTEKTDSGSKQGKNQT